MTFDVDDLDLAPGVRHLLAIVFDGSTFRRYVNGEEVRP